ncbi:MAG: hypothetical protein RSC29_06825, partial [Oscillospiraceae bacterium]
SASDELKSVVLATGGTVIQSKISDAEFMKQVLKFGTPEQFKFCFNGIYATVTLLDYLNHNALSFDALVETLPLVNKSEIDIPCSKQKKMIIMSALKEAFKNEKIDTTDGLKIFNDKGWALIVPSDRQNYIKIISEGFNTEAASEISNS